MIDTATQRLNDIKSTIDSLVAINHVESINMNDITLTKKIGEGGQSTVYEAQYKCFHVAIKILQNIDYNGLAHEIVILANLIHPSIPKFYGMINEPKTMALVFEYIKGRTLDEIKVNDVSFQHKLKIAKSIGSILEYMHVNNFIHRDIKPGNVIVDEDWNTHLIDFGISKICINKRYTITRTKGTLSYLAPECLEIHELNEEEEILSKITTKVDVWSFGCLICYLFSGISPWDNQYQGSDPEIQKALMTKTLFPIPDKIQTNAILNEIVSKATHLDYNERISMTEINEILYSIPCKNTPEI